MRGYTQLTQEERYQIYVLKKAGHNQTVIASLLGRDKGELTVQAFIQSGSQTGTRNKIRTRQRDIQFGSQNWCKHGRVNLYYKAVDKHRFLAACLRCRNVPPFSMTPSHGKMKGTGNRTFPNPY